MVKSKVRNRRLSPVTAMRRRRMFYVLAAAMGAGMLAVAALPSAGPASAQDPTQPGIQQPPGSGAPGQPTMDPITTDPITNEQIELLKESGLIEKQSELSEGLLLMDRQLRQAQLVEQLIQVLGPNAQIEVTPGEFKSFANTPAGLRQRLEYLKLQNDLQEAQSESGAAGFASSFSGTGVSQIYGSSGNLSAVIAVDGQQKTVESGDRLEDGSVILSISPEKVELQRADGTMEVLKAP